ncbi:MAG: hypothetical protein ACTSPB_11235 [Candidatus Thorarchaeota archaeon]
MSTENPPKDEPTFDPNKFMDTPPGEALTDTPPSDTPPADTPPSDTPPADGDDVFTWDSDETPPSEEPPTDTPPADGDDTPPADTPPKDETPPADNTPPAETPPQDTPPTEPNLDLDTEIANIAKEVGLEDVKDKDQLSSTLTALLKENQQLKQQQQGQVQTDRTKTLEGYLGLSDEDLLRKDFEAKGLSGDDLDAAMNDLESRGVLKAQATLARKNINAAIEGEKARHLKAAEQQSQEQEQAIEQNREEFRKHIDGVDEMFGFKIGKDENATKKMRDSQFDYVTSGKFMEEITSSNEALLEASWLYRHRANLVKAFENRGLQRGKAEVLDDMRLPDPGPGSGRPPVASDSGEFNPKKFNETPAESK